MKSKNIQKSENYQAPKVFWNRLNSFAGRRPTRPLYMRHMRPVEEFRVILDRERVRADRSEHGFSLVVFDVGNPAVDSALALSVVQALKRRLRSTDEVRWFDEKRIGVILPDTPAEGAWKLADGVCQMIDITSPRPMCTVYIYPSRWLSGDDGGLVQRIAVPTGSHRRPVAAMEPLFIRRLPAWKRAMDVIGAIVGLVVFSPLMLVVAIAVKLSSPGPIIFKQKRAGQGGHPFTFYKFRSMYVGAEEKKKKLMKYNEQTGPVFKMKKDPRITPVGRFIRKYSIDEMPQLWNVLKGDMSLVGPRPPTLDEVPHYSRWQRRRLDVTPGLTCIWQISGRSLVGFNAWVRMDIKYSEIQSLLTDLKILLRTPLAVLARRGAC